MIGLLFGFAAALIVASQVTYRKSETLLEKALVGMEKTVTINLFGAVAQPGAYDVKPGSTLRELLKKAALTEDADKKKIPFKKVFYTSETVEIPKK